MVCRPLSRETSMLAVLVKERRATGAGSLAGDGRADQAAREGRAAQPVTELRRLRAPRVEFDGGFHTAPPTSEASRILVMNAFARGRPGRQQSGSERTQGECNLQNRYTAALAHPNAADRSRRKDTKASRSGPVGRLDQLGDPQ